MKSKVLNKLTELNIDFRMDEHPPIFTIGELEDYSIDDKHKIAKNLFLRNDKGNQHYLVVIRQDKVVNLKALRSQIGSSRLGFASEERLMKHLDLSKGSVTPLGILNNDDAKVKVLFDVDLKTQDIIGFHPNENNATVWLTFEDILKVIEDHGNEVGYVEV